MREDFSWVFSIYREYKKSRRREPHFLSDWDVDLSKATYLETLIDAATSLSDNSESLHLFSEDIRSQKKLIADHLSKQQDYQLTHKEICISLNPANDLCLTVYSLIKLGIKRFMVATPAYYPIIETIKDFGGDLSFFHLNDHNNFRFDLEQLNYQISEQHIEALVITDPVYSAGIPIPIEQFTGITETCQKKSLWLIVDYSMGGLDWNNESVSHIQKEKLYKLNKQEKKVVVTSLTENLFLNNLKSSVIIGENKIIECIEDLAYTVFGGMCITQLNVLDILHQSGNFDLINKLVCDNIKRIKQNYSLLKAAILGTGWSLYPTSTGCFTMLFHKEKLLKEVNSKKFFTKLLMGNHIRGLPSSYFGYYENNHFSIRVNLLKEIRNYLPDLISSINKHL